MGFGESLKWVDPQTLKENIDEDIRKTTGTFQERGTSSRSLNATETSWNRSDGAGDPKSLSADLGAKRHSWSNPPLYEVPPPPNPHPGTNISRATEELAQTDSRELYAQGYSPRTSFLDAL